MRSIAVVFLVLLASPCWGQTPVTFDGTSSPCTTEGWNWDSGTSTCTMTSDLVGRGVVFGAGSNGTTLDCAQHIICAVAAPATTCNAPAIAFPTVGVQAIGRNGIALKNCSLHGFYTSQYYETVTGLHVQNVRVTGSSAYLLPAPDKSRFDAPLMGLDMKDVTSSTIEDLDISGAGYKFAARSQGAQSGNTFRRWFLHDNLVGGVVISYDNTYNLPTANTGNLYEDLWAEGAAEMRNPHRMFFIAANDSVARRIRTWKRGSYTAASFLSGLDVAGANMVVEDSQLTGASFSAMILVGMVGSNVTIRNTTMRDNGGGIVFPSKGHVHLENNTICSAPAVPYTDPYGVTFADLTKRLPTVVTTSGSGNMCSTSRRCTLVSSDPYIYDCADFPDLEAYQDSDATIGQACRFVCPPGP